MLPVFHNPYYAISYKFCAELNKGRKRLKTLHPFSLWDDCMFGFTTRRVWWQESVGSPPVRRHFKIFWRKFYTSAWTIDRPLIMGHIQSTLNSEAHYILYVKLKIPNTSSYTTLLIKASDMTRHKIILYRMYVLLHSLLDVKGLFIREVKINNAWIMASWRLKLSDSRTNRNNFIFHSSIARFLSKVCVLCWSNEDIETLSSDIPVDFLFFSCARLSQQLSTDCFLDAMIMASIFVI